MKISKSYFIYLSIFILSFCFNSCRKDELNEQVQVQRTVLVYMAGDNSLSSYVETNLAQMEQGMRTNQLNVGRLLVLADDGNINTQLLEITNNGRKVLKSYGANLNTAEVSTFQEVWKDVKSLSPAAGYGLILWSHGTGWYPSRNIASDIEYLKVESQSKVRMRAFGLDGNDWMSTEDLATALPDNEFEFIIFDACYMASVELLYSLRNKSTYFIVSPTEILGSGLPYDEILNEVLVPKSELRTALKRICKKYFDYYENQSGSFQSAAISLICANKLSDLARKIRDLNLAVSIVNSTDVQRFNRQQFYPCFDFTDAYLHANNSRNEWSEELDSVVLVEYHTKNFIDLPISSCCGLSTYIPQANEPIINELYRNTLWYKAVNKK